MVYVTAITASNIRFTKQSKAKTARNARRQAIQHAKGNGVLSGAVQVVAINGNVYHGKKVIF